MVQTTGGPIGARAQASSLITPSFGWRRLRSLASCAKLKFAAKVVALPPKLFACGERII